MTPNMFKKNLFWLWLTSVRTAGFREILQSSQVIGIHVSTW